MDLVDKILAGDILCYDLSRCEQELYLSKLGKASDDYERSFKQYKGQVLYMSLKKRAILNSFSLLAYPFVLFVLILRGIGMRKKQRREAIGRLRDSQKFVPDSLETQYDIDKEIWWLIKDAIYWKDIPFALSVFVKYFFYPYFVLKTTLKLSKYSAIIYQYSPKAIIVHDEFSFTSSILTKFCEKYQVLHLDVMHGEKLFDLHDSFFRFHKCYIWDKHYKQLFISLNAEPNQFVIELPQSMIFNTEDYYSLPAFADYKYYLGLYNEREIISIVNSMRQVENKGKTVKYRPHPNYSDVNLLKKYVPEDKIENPLDVDILTSVSSLNYAVGVDSTVLSQAYFNNKEVVLDDVTFKNRVIALKDLDYILISKVNNRLSQLQS